jgi:hypothetical protein
MGPAVRLLTGLSLCALASACSPSLGMIKVPATGVRLTGSLTLGPVDGANVGAFSVDPVTQGPGRLLSKGTVRNGTFELDVPSDVTPILLRATGGSYVEESGGSSVALDQELRALVPNEGEDRDAAINPLSDIAAERALSQVSWEHTPAEIAALATEANEEVATAAGLSGDITAILPIDPTIPYTSQGVDATSSRVSVALFLAGISELGNSMGKNSVEMTKAFAQDFARDGSFDGSDTGGAIDIGGGTLLANNAWTTGLPNAQDNFMNSAANVAEFPPAAKTVPSSGPGTPSPSASPDPSSSPSPVPTLSPIASTSTTKLRGGYSHACVILPTKIAKCWGNNQDGLLGAGFASGSSTPVAVTSLVGNVEELALGTYHSCAIVTGGGVKCWGANGTYGLLGIAAADPSTRALVPVSVLNVSNAIGIVAESYNTCALISGGTVKCWGQSNFILAYGAMNPVRSSEGGQTVPGLTGIVKLFKGGGNICGLRSDGKAFCWTGFNMIVNEVTGVSNPLHIGGGGMRCVVSATGALSCEGGDAHGLPTTILSNALTVDGFAHDYCSIVADGTVRCFGDNYYGTMGDGTFSGLTDPWVTSPVEPLGLGPVDQLVVGGEYACALTADQRVKCWGANYSGQVGDGTTSNRMFPTAVFGL